MQERKFYICRHCGNIITKLNNSGVPVVCCGEPMQELVPGSTDAAGEKHVPVVTVEGGKVSVVVGSVAHPMTPEHYIQWIYLDTENGGQFKYLTPDSEPKATFELGDDVPIGVYEYCNLHGLWYGA